MSEHEPTFTIAEIEKIAKLANLDLSEMEKALFARQFGEILGYFHKLAAVDTSAVDGATESGKPAEHTKQPLYREDAVVPSGITPESFSPYLENGHFKVPRVID